MEADVACPQRSLTSHITQGFLCWPSCVESAAFNGLGRVTASQGKQVRSVTFKEHRRGFLALRKVAGHWQVTRRRRVLGRKPQSLPPSSVGRERCLGTLGFCFDAVRQSRCCTGIYHSILHKGLPGMLLHFESSQLFCDVNKTLSRGKPGSGAQCFAPSL